MGDIPECDYCGKPLVHWDEHDMLVDERMCHACAFYVQELQEKMENPIPVEDGRIHVFSVDFE